MSDLIGPIVIAAEVVFIIGFFHWMHRRDRIRDAQHEAEHQQQMAELERQRQLRELEDLRRGLLRGREHACAFCGVADGVLDAELMCMDVEACLQRADILAQGEPR